MKSLKIIIILVLASTRMFQPHTKLHELLAHDYWIVIITNLENRFICFLRNLYIENML